MHIRDLNHLIPAHQAHMRFPGTLVTLANSASDGQPPSPETNATCLIV